MVLHSEAHEVAHRVHHIGQVSDDNPGTGETERADGRNWRLLLDRLSLPRRRSRLQRAIGDRLSSSIGRRWSIGLTFPFVRVPEMLDQATLCEGVSKLGQVVTKWGRGQIVLKVRTISLGGLVIPE
jgi:hypothetical protein